MGKPALFTWPSTLILAFAVVATTGLAITSESRPLVFIARLTLGLLATGAWVAFVYHINARWNEIKDISFITRHGLIVMDSQFTIKQDDVEEITELTIQRWQAYDPSAAEAVKGLKVIFNHNAFEHPKKPGIKLGGVALLDEKTLEVGYVEPLEKSALAHELGHFIYARWEGLWSEQSSHAFMETNGLF